MKDRKDELQEIQTQLEEVQEQLAEVLDVVLAWTSLSAEVEGVLEDI